MKIDDDKIAIIITGILELDEIFQCAEIIADMQSAGWLDSRNKNGIFIIPIISRIAA